MAHRQRGADGVNRVIRIVQRRVPERHNRVADIFVDRAAVREHDVGHCREIFVDEPRQRLRIQLLGNGRKAAHIREHDGEGTHLTAEDELARILGDPIGDCRRDITGERLANAAPAFLFVAIQPDHAGPIAEHNGKARQQRVQQQTTGGKLLPARPAQQRQDGDHREHAGNGRQSQQHEFGAEGQKDGEDQLGAARPIRPEQPVAGERLFDGLRMNLDARDRGVDRRGALIVQSGGAGAEHYHAAFDLGAIDRTGEYLPRRDELPAFGRRIADAQIAARIRRNFDVPDFDAVRPCARRRQTDRWHLKI